MLHIQPYSYVSGIGVDSRSRHHIVGDGAAGVELNCLIELDMSLCPLMLKASDPMAQLRKDPAYHPIALSCKLLPLS